LQSEPTEIDNPFANSVKAKCCCY